MAKRYPEYKKLSLPEIDAEVMRLWQEGKTFERSVSQREGSPAFTFYEGPPSANGRPGIHHVFARAIKDIFCRYKTLQGFQVKRKGGWDTHGLPVELQVEKRLGISKDDIGKSISVADYNRACREDVLKFKDIWDDLTRRMGYWVDLDQPYITFENAYIESCWNLLKRLWEKDLLYKGFTIQPYSPAAGTGLSSHELNLPGCYKEVKDTSVTAQFALSETSQPLLRALLEAGEEVFILAWTTTPWTLPSNTALALGKDISYAALRSYNPYTHRPMVAVLAEELVGKYFQPEGAEVPMEAYEPGDKLIPYRLLGSFRGEALLGSRYHQLLPYVQPAEPAFRIIHGDFVSTSDGTGIVHIAPTFGGDDFIVARQNGIPPLLVRDEEGAMTPLVNKQGRFVKEVSDFAGRFVKDYGPEPEERSVDVDIAIKLKEENKAFRVEKYVHTYPHCWRTDKPVLYYPLDSWFIRTTAVKDKLIQHNNQINWQPPSTGTGRFGNWLENLVDWNLSRSRYWGIPLPVWSSEDGNERLCVGSVAELRAEMEKSVAAGLMTAEHLADFLEKDDLHRPWVDEITLVSPSGRAMRRESDLIDVWFDSGAMPYAQWHYPFDNQDVFRSSFPADFISEGVDQTRGWFFTLHALAVMLEDSPAFKNVISTGLLLDKDGRKMSKRLGNIVDPFETLARYGADATRWYMILNAPPWENMRFDVKGIEEVQRRFFGTLFNTYNFFALYANLLEGEDWKEKGPAALDELDRWVLSVLNSLVRDVEGHLNDYDPTRAVRAIDYFVNEQLSNWYVRLSRRRFWDGDAGAFYTLHRCLETVALLMSPVAPFYAERLYRDLSGGEGTSVHLAAFPRWTEADSDRAAEARMEMAQRITSLILSIRRKESLRVRQPLARALAAILDPALRKELESVQSLISAEVNVRSIEYIAEDDPILVKKVKPNFKVLGPKAGSRIKEIGGALATLGQEQIRQLERDGQLTLDLPGGAFELGMSEVEIQSQDIPGWSVASDGPFTVALDITLSEELVREGIAREFVNRIQNLRKSSGLEVSDHIRLKISAHPSWNSAVEGFTEYICQETLCDDLQLLPAESLAGAEAVEINEIEALIFLELSSVAKPA